MRKEQSELYHTRESTRHFLYSKVEPADLEMNKNRAPISIQKAIHSAYPGLLTGHSFLDHAAEQLASETTFSCVVLRIEEDAGTASEPSASDPAAVYAKTAELLDGWRKKHNSSWGLFDPKLFGSYLPGKNGSQCLDLVHRLQKSLTKKTGVTASAGVAAYPILRYKPTEILANARKALDHAAFFGPGSAVVFDAVSLNISGDKLFDKGDLKGAIREFKRALELDPSNINVHNSLGVCYGLRGDYQKAGLEFKAVIKLQSTEVMAWYNLGFAVMLAGDRDEALDLLLKANAINEDVFEVAFQTGRLLLEMDQPESGIKYLEHASRLDPKSGAVYRYLGECNTCLGEGKAAISAYKKAIKHNPSDAAALSAMGCLFDEQDENPEISLMFCRESVKLAPENGLFRHRLGQLYFKQNRMDDALKEFKKAELLGQDVGEYILLIQNQLQTKAS